MKGTVKWFNKTKGYGFVNGEDGESYFVHHSQVPEGVFLNENDPVEFDPADTERGKQAQNLRPAGDSASSDDSSDEDMDSEEDDQ